MLTPTPAITTPTPVETKTPTRTPAKTPAHKEKPIWEKRVVMDNRNHCAGTDSCGAQEEEVMPRIFSLIFLLCYCYPF